MNTSQKEALLAIKKLTGAWFTSHKMPYLEIGRLMLKIEWLANNALTTEVDEQIEELPYRVGLFWSSVDEERQVRVLCQGAEIASSEKHASFIRWL